VGEQNWIRKWNGKKAQETSTSLGPLVRLFYYFLLLTKVLATTRLTTHSTTVTTAATATATATTRNTRKPAAAIGRVKQRGYGMGTFQHGMSLSPLFHLFNVYLLVYYQLLSPTSSFATKSRVANQWLWLC
jgi:hypothetical protein